MFLEKTAEIIRITIVRRGFDAFVSILTAFVFSIVLAGCGGGGGMVPVRQLPVDEPPDPVIYEPFTLIVVPDSQYYVEDYPAIFSSQMSWTAANRDALNIKFLLHEGDITNRNTDIQWQSAADSISQLDGVVPYALAVGNHDMSGSSAARFNSYFPVSRFEGMSSFGGVFEPGEMKNSYHYFTAAGADWMIVVLEYEPREEVLQWAASLAQQNPLRRVIILTHAYLAPGGSRSSTGNNIWNKFAKLHKNISFVFNGHYTDDYSSRLVSTGDNGNKVYQMFADYQTLTFGGLGLLRIVRFDRDARKVSVKTFSTSSNFYRTGDADEFEFTDVELGPPIPLAAARNAHAGHSGPGL